MSRSSSLAKPVIAVDVDEVLFPLINNFTVWHNREYDTNLVPHMFTTYEFHDTLQLTIPETISRIRQYFGNDHALIQPVDGAQQTINRLSNAYKIVVVTARNPNFRNVTEAYLETYFGSHISDLYMVGNKGDTSLVRSKAEVCKEIHAVALIDDSLKHVSACADIGMQGVLFGDYSWNGYQGQPPERVVRCADWNEVAEFFDV